jgi:CRISPR/Cas system-associated endoribonuclease Cas2
MEEPPCFCNQLQNANIPDTCFRHGHLATTDIGHVLPFCGVEKDTPSFDEAQVVWMQGSKFRGALCKQTAVEKLKSSIDKYIEDLLDSLPIIRAMEIRNMSEALRAWKSEVLLRYDKLCDDPRNFRISFKTKKAIIEVNKRFVIAPVDKNPQSMAILCRKDYARRLSEHMNSDTYERVTESVHRILDRQKTFVRSFNCKFVPALPYIYIIPKLHKEPARPFDRFIAGNSHLNRVQKKPPDQPLLLPSSSTHHCSRRISDFFNAVIDMGHGKPV